MMSEDRHIHSCIQEAPWPVVQTGGNLYFFKLKRLRNPASLGCNIFETEVERQVKMV